MILTFIKYIVDAFWVFLYELCKPFLLFAKNIIIGGAKIAKALIKIFFRMSLEVFLFLFGELLHLMFGRMFLKHRIVGFYEGVYAWYRLRRYLLGLFIRQKIYLLIFLLLGVGSAFLSTFFSSTDWIMSFLQNLGAGFITSALVIFFYDFMRQIQERYEHNNTRGLYLVDLLDKILDLLALIISLHEQQKGNTIRRELADASCDKIPMETVLTKVLSQKMWLELPGISHLEFSIVQEREWKWPGLNDSCSILSGRNVEETIQDLIFDIATLSEKVFHSSGTLFPPSVLRYIWELKNIRYLNEPPISDNKFSEWLKAMVLITFYYKANCINYAPPMHEEISYILWRKLEQTPLYELRERA